MTCAKCDDELLFSARHRGDGLCGPCNRSVDHGIYRLNWRDGGSSLASVGSDSRGARWFMPTNWISGPSFDWTKVGRAVLLMKQVIDA